MAPEEAWYHKIQDSFRFEAKYLLSGVYTITQDLSGLTRLLVAVPLLACSGTRIRGQLTRVLANTIAATIINPAFMPKESISTPAAKDPMNIPIDIAVLNIPMVVPMP